MTVTTVRMEYCLEIAVFQSAFQLIDKQAGKELATISKDRCGNYVKVICATVEEICTGLERDLDPDEMLLWRQKLHAVVVYVLVQKKYKDKKEPARPGRVPVRNFLDMMCEVLPEYSTAFYFELVKQLGWTLLMLQSFQCLDYQTAKRLLEDLLKHCEVEPVTLNDTEVVALVTESLLTRCVCVPDDPSQVTSELLEPLTCQQNYIQTVYMENMDDSVAMATGNSKMTKHVVDDLCQTEKVGKSFWDMYTVDKSCRHLFALSIDCITTRLKHLPASEEEISEVELGRICSQIGLWWYLIKVWRDNDVTDKWFVNNIFVPKETWKQKLEVKNAGELVYSINYTLLENLFQSEGNMKLIEGLQQTLLEVLTAEDATRQVVSEEPKEFSSVELNPKNARREKSSKNKMVEVVADLAVCETMLERMLTDVADSQQREDTDDSRSAQQMDAGLEGIVLESKWVDDVTLDALLWRIENRLPQYQVCVDRLLEMKCWKFWHSERVYSVLFRQTSLFGQVDHVLALVQILKNLEECPQRETDPQMVELIQAAFTELSFPGQDRLITQIYCTDQDHVANYFCNGLQRKVTNVFNKITADLSDQVLQEVLQLCLGDPALVVKTLVQQCVQNDQQAVNCAKIAEQLSSLCRCRHPGKHPDMTLLASSIEEFLSSQPLTNKEQKCFLGFVGYLIKNSPNRLSVLSVPEFLNVSVLPRLSVDTLRNAEATVVCSFAASLLSVTLHVTCNNISDWSEFELEPMALVLTLAELKHECVVLWEEREAEKEKGITMHADVPKVKGNTKVTVREAVTQCLEELCQLISDGRMKVEERDLEWIVMEASDLHWTVRLALCPILEACGIYKYREMWLDSLNNLLTNPVVNLLVMLQFIAVDGTLVDHVLDRLSADSVFSYEELVHALVQVFPQCLASQCENIVTFLESLLSRGDYSATVVYRFRSTSNLPLLDFSGLQGALYTSQLLCDTILTLVETLTSVEESRSMIQHSLQCYVYVTQKRTSLVGVSQDLQLLYISELFHQVCEVTLHLPAEIMDSSLVLLLHIVTKFKDIVTTTQKDQRLKVKSEQTGLKLVKNLENRVCAVVHGLPDSCEEKSMLLKKICE